MKKLLLCGILGILSQQLIAEPILKVININQELEMENENGKQDFDDVWLWNKVMEIGYLDLLLEKIGQ